jgi:prohibitin 2
MADTARVEPDQPGPGFRLWRSFKRWYWARRLTILLVVLVALFALVMLAPFVLITVPPGHLGVLWKRFSGGTVIGDELGEGLQVIFPWDRIYIYNGRLQAHTETYEVISKDGLSLQVVMTFRWQPLGQNLAALHRDIGPNYVEALLVPEIGSIARDVIAQHEWQDLVSRKRQDIQQQILSATTDPSPAALVTRLVEPAFVRARGVTSFNYVGVKDILIATVILPPSLRMAIERKLEQSQLVEEYQYRLDRETLESQRKAIEAEGIRAFQQTVQAGISETYLKWRGIEATLELARSPNAKIVVIGGNNGLPIILNTGDELKGGPAGSPSSIAKPDQPPSALRPNQPGDATPAPNLPEPSPLAPLPSPPTLTPIPTPTPGPPSAVAPSAPPPSGGSPDGGASIIEQLGTTLARSFGWNSPPGR